MFDERDSLWKRRRVVPSSQMGGKEEKMGEGRHP